MSTCSVRARPSWLLETGEDDGEDERPLGPRLDEFLDYDEHRFAEELRTAYGKLRLWLTLLAPAALLVLVVWRLHSSWAGLVVSLPLFYLAGRSLGNGREDRGSDPRTGHLHGSRERGHRPLAPADLHSQLVVASQSGIRLCEADGRDCAIRPSG